MGENGMRGPDDPVQAQGNCDLEMDEQDGYLPATWMYPDLDPSASIDTIEASCNYLLMTNIVDSNNVTSGNLLGRLGRLRACCEAMDLEIRTQTDLSEAQCAFLTGMPADAEVTTGDLCNRIGVSPSRGGRVIEELVVRELLIRQTNPHDRRVSRVSLTPNGEALRSRLLTLMTTCESEVLAELDPAERSTVETGLSLLDAAIGRVLDRKQSLDTETPVRKPWRPAR